MRFADSSLIDKILTVAAMVVLLSAFFFLDLGRFLSIVALKESLSQLLAWRSAAPVVAGAVFFAIYVAVAALAVPGAAIMTVAAGALFGLGWGTALVSFASSAGAVLSFLASRFVLRDAIQARFGARLKALNDGITKDGPFYLFTLRLVPVFPFFLVNLLSGLTPMPVRTFYWVSQVGMLAGTLVFVNAGTQLGTLTSLGDILSPRLLVSFALLGIFPLVADRAIGLLRRRRVYAKWSRPRHFDRNLVVIGAGAAGLVTAYIAATVKASVTLVEAEKMGGDCLNYGCVPSKALLRSARHAHQLRHGSRYGFAGVSPAPAFASVMARVHAVIRAVAPHDSVERYTELGVDVVQGYARIVDPWTVEVALNRGGTRRITTRAIVVAAGARPFVPALPGLEEVGYLTSDTLWDAFAKLDAPPPRLLVLGGGPIGCELSQAFARLGSQVTLVQRAGRLMVREDPEVSALVHEALTGDGVTVLTAHQAVRCEREGQSKFLVVEHAGAHRRIEFDVLLCAVGRVARLSGYGLEELGVDTSGTVGVNAFLQTRIPNIYAAGDVAGPYQFTHVAAHQAWYAAVNGLFGDLWRFKVDYSVIPWVTFVDPEVARVGLNEQQAREQGIAYEVARYGFDDLDRAIAEGATGGYLNVLTVPGKDRILGVTIVGDHAGELLAEFVLAMKHGLGLNKILATIHPYPTMAEANKYVAGQWKRAHAPHHLLTWLARYHTWKRGATPGPGGTS